MPKATHGRHHTPLVGIKKKKYEIISRIFFKELVVKWKKFLEFLKNVYGIIKS